MREAVLGIDINGECSPNKVRQHLKQTKPEPWSQTTSPTALTAEGRKFPHSRSSTEQASILLRTSHCAESLLQPSKGGEDEDFPLARPALVRKKSGELVKFALRPSLPQRCSSLPATPTYQKSVHFLDSDNQTRYFLQVDKPTAVSAGSSLAETEERQPEYPYCSEASAAEREIRLANFPEETLERRLKPIRVERIFLSSDKQMLIGTCTVQTIAFREVVVARFTLDYWETISEVTAEYTDDRRQSASDGCDHFNFWIKLSDCANIDNKTLLLCVRYSADGKEFWDNKDNIDYQVDFVQTAETASRAATPSPPSQLHKNFGGRYDFDASLSAASSNAQDKLGHISNSCFSLKQRKDGPTAAVVNKSIFCGNTWPAIGSDQYRDLIQRFCYVGCTSSTTRTPSTTCAAKLSTAALA